jgi:hypothetical protein
MQDDEEGKCLICRKTSYYRMAIYVRGKPDYSSGYRWIRIPKVYVCAGCRSELEAQEKKRQDERKAKELKRRRH